MTRSRYMALGLWESDLAPFPRVDSLKILGVTFCSDLSTSLRKNWSLLVNRIHTHAIKVLSKRLSLIQRVWYSNIYLLSKMWFLAKVFPPRKLDTQAIEKFIGYHIWRNYPYRVSRDQLRLPNRRGGLSLVDTATKCTSLFLKQINDTANGEGDEFEISYLQNFLNPTSPNYRDYPVYMRQNAKLYDSLYPNNTTAFSSTRILYDTLMANKPVRVPIELKRPHIQWSLVWGNFHRSPMPTEWRTSMYLVINDSIGYADKLFRHQRSQSNRCTLCSQIETLVHKMFDCPGIKNIWEWLLRHLKVNLRIPLSDLENVRSFRFDNNYDLKKKNAFFWLVAAYFHFILSNQKRKRLSDFKSTIRLERWKMLKTRKINSLFGHYLFLF